MVHGDAAFAGQGVVAETLNLSQLRGYRTGGTIHIVVNNQVGFTTAPSSSRSSTYSTDVAKMIQAPVFHVNGDDPEAVVRIGQLAYEFRQRFHKDVVIDMVCYRRRGHNEGDDPSMTQPLMYNLIEAKRSVRKLYTESLIGRGDITEEEAEQLLRDYQERLERVFAETHAAQTSPDSDHHGGFGSGIRSWSVRTHSSRTSASSAPASTAISADTLARIGKAHVEIPEGFTVHAKLKQLLEKREVRCPVTAASTGASANSLPSARSSWRAFPSGSPARTRAVARSCSATLSSTTAPTATSGCRSANLSDDQAKLWIYDSLLSEYAAMGFEYGYSVERPDALVLWEAQFGDFVNGAQTIIDEFISSAEQKWGQRSSLVLMLPHGYEGQGPDHSSARIERFLQMCAEENMIVANPTTAASHFHLLRRQAYSRPRKPLIIFTPKQLLRLKAAASSVEDFTTGGFRPVISEHEQLQVGRRRTCTAGLRTPVLRSAVHAAEDGRQDDGDRPRRAALPAAAGGDRPPNWPSTRTRKLSGRRTSPPTRVRGRSWV
jgi:2-oxoglutarate decarboxylase